MQDTASNRFEKLRLELRRGTLVLAVLAALSEEEYGYSLRKKLNDAGLEVDEGTLYPLIRRLESQKLLDSRWDASPEGRKRRYYIISSHGRSVLEELRKEWSHLNATLKTLIEKSS